MKNRVWLALALAVLATATIAGAAQVPAEIATTNSGGNLGALSDCTPFPDYQQPLDQGPGTGFNTARTSDAQIPLEIREDVVDGGGAITTLPAGSVSGLRWWGISLEFNPQIGFVGFCGNDDAALTTYNLKFYANSGSAPGTLLDTRTVAPSALVDTGIAFGLGANIIQYDATFAPVDTTNVSWIAIQRTTGQQATSGNDCYFLWVDEVPTNTYDNMANSLTAGVQTTDQVMCVALGAAEADLSIDKVGQVNGNQIVYTLTVTNNGPDDATGVVVVDDLPPEVAYVSDDCGGSNVPPWTWNVGALANGASATCNITVDALAITVVNTASVTGDQTDNNGGNDASTSTVVTGSVVAIPTLGSLGLFAMLLLLAGAGFYVMRSR